MLPFSFLEILELGPGLAIKIWNTTPWENSREGVKLKASSEKKRMSAVVYMIALYIHKEII